MMVFLFGLDDDKTERRLQRRLNAELPLKWRFGLVMSMALTGGFAVLVGNLLGLQRYLVILLIFMASIVVALCFARWATRILRIKMEEALREEGRCLICGYDTRGNRSDVCPECGHAMERADASRHGHENDS